jgi:hypothetical protein
MMAKQKITVWVSNEVFTAIKARADSERADLSPTTAKILARAIADGVQGSLRYSPTVQAFQEAVGEATKAKVELVAGVASKAALYAIAGRMEIQHLLVQKFGVEAAKSIQQEGWRKAIEALKKPLEREP